VTPRTKLLLALPAVAVFVIVLAYFRLFTDPLVVVLIFILYVAITLRNRRKFKGPSKDEKRKGKKGPAPSYGGESLS